MATFTPRELALHIARLLDGKGQDIAVLQQPVGAQSFDYVVLATASSERLAYHLVEEVWHFCKRHGVEKNPIEGETGWLLLDCYEVVVHALSPESREKYQLEDLWRLSRKVDWAKELKTLDDPDKPAPKKTKATKAKVEAEAAEGADEEAPAPKPKKRVAKAKKAVAEPEAKPAAPKKRKPATRVNRGDRDTTELPKVEPAALTKRKPSLTRKKAR